MDFWPAGDFSTSSITPAAFMGLEDIRTPADDALVLGILLFVLRATKGVPKASPKNVAVLASHEEHRDSNDVPYHDYYEYYAPDFDLHLKPEPRENLKKAE